MPGVARIDVNGRVTRQILDPDQARGADRARHRRRPGDERDARPRTRTCPPGASRAGRATRSCASRARSRTRRSSAGSSSRSRAARPSTCRRSPTSSTARRSRTRSRASTAARRSRSTCRRRRTRTSSRPGRGVARTRWMRSRQRLPADVELRVVNSQRGSGREQRQPRQGDDRRGRAPHGADRVPVPAQLAQHDHHRPHAAASP